jgi:predicted enzyme related to lactoylglutathione lyase
MFTDTEAFSGFAVDDLEAAQKFYGETLGGINRAGGPYIGWFKDPAGNILAVLQER